MIKLYHYQCVELSAGPYSLRYHDAPFMTFVQLISHAYFKSTVGAI